MVQLYYPLRLWLCALRLLGSLRTSKTCLRHQRLLKRTMSSLERSSLQLKLCCLRIDLWDLYNSLRSWCLDSRISELAAVCFFCVSGLIHFRHRVMRFTANEDTWYKFPPLSFLLLGTSCLGRPSVTIRATYLAPARIWLAVIDFQKSIIVYSRFIKMPLG